MDVSEDPEDLARQVADARVEQASLDERLELSTQQGRAHEAAVAQVLEQALAAIADPARHDDRLRQVVHAVVGMIDGQDRLVAEQAALAVDGVESALRDETPVPALRRRAEALRLAADVTENLARMHQLHDAALRAGLGSTS